MGRKRQLIPTDKDRQKVLSAFNACGETSMKELVSSGVDPRIVRILVTEFREAGVVTTNGKSRRHCRYLLTEEGQKEKTQKAQDPVEELPSNQTTPVVTDPDNPNTDRKDVKDNPSLKANLILREFSSGAAHTVRDWIASESARLASPAKDISLALARESGLPVADIQAAIRAAIHFGLIDRFWDQEGQGGLGGRQRYLRRPS